MGQQNRYSWLNQGIGNYEQNYENYDTLLSKIGIKNRKTTIVLFSDFNNWFAAIVFWIFKPLDMKMSSY